MFHSLALSLLSFLLIHPRLSSTAPLPAPQIEDLRLISTESVTPLYQFPRGSWLENIAIRPNGHILVTRLDVPELWEINPFSPSTSYDAKLLYTFSNASGLTGIAEIAPDVFAVAAGVPTNPAGSFSVWKVSIDTQGNVAGTKVVSIPEALVLNGMALLSSHKGGTILVGDHTQGLVYRVDMGNGDRSVAIHDPAMLPPGPPNIGVNGLKIQKGHLFFTNMLRGTLCKIPINNLTGVPTGPVDVITSNIFGADDLTLDASGTAYVTINLSNRLAVVRPDGGVEIIAGAPGSTDLPGPTSAAFGRTAGDDKTIYVVTSGARLSPINGTYVEGGKVVAVKLK